MSRRDWTMTVELAVRTWAPKVTTAALGFEARFARRAAHPQAEGGLDAPGEKDCRREGVLSGRRDHGMCARSVRRSWGGTAMTMLIKREAGANLRLLDDPGLPPRWDGPHVGLRITEGFVTFRALPLKGYSTEARWMRRAAVTPSHTPAS
jgi:hypothetical protein